MLSDEFNRYAPLYGVKPLLGAQPLFGLFAGQTEAEEAEDERQPFESYDDWRERISPFAPSRLPNPF
jgi:hypothetical protein